MEMLMIARFSKVTFDEWLAVYEGDAELRAKFMKDDIVAKIDEHTAIVKATITDPEGMQEIMASRMAEVADKMGLEHEPFILTPAG
jgi:hypothetical protein